MGLKKYIKKYREYENVELARRTANKNRVTAYKELKNTALKNKRLKDKELAQVAANRKKIAARNALRNKKIPVNKKRRLNLKGFTKSIGNPYGTKFPKAKKKLNKVKGRKK